MRVAAFTVALLAAGCAPDQELNYKQTDPTVVEDGAIIGRVCDPSGRTWLADAQAYVNLFNDEGVIVDTKMAFSDLDGYWTIDELPGDRYYTVYVQYGPETLQQERDIWVGSGETIEIEEPDCFDPLAIDVAVVTGSYDDFNLVLNQMGFANYVLIDGIDPDVVSDFLDDPAELEKYDIIFFNGGFTEDGVIYDTVDPANTLPAARMQNIVDYVNNGGSIYASDWAYDVVELGWPDRADFVGADEVPGEAQKGDYDEVTAAVSDSSLSEFLGTTYIPIAFDLPVWPPVVSVEPSVSTHLSGTVPYSEGLSEYSLSASPILFSFNSGDGKVVFSTFRVARNANDEMVGTLQYMMYRL